MPKPTLVIHLRDVHPDDLSVFFEQQLDPAANRMAAFTRKDPADREAFNAHWEKIIGDQAVIVRTILYGGQIAGHIASYVRLDQREVTYWVGKEYWGQGIATAALTAFLAIETTRPLYGGAAKDNAASIRVMEKCGFRLTDEDRGFANGRGEEIDEVFLMLE